MLKRLVVVRLPVIRWMLSKVTMTMAQRAKVEIQVLPLVTQHKEPLLKRSKAELLLRRLWKLRKVPHKR